MITITPKQIEALRQAAEKHGVRTYANEIRQRLLRMGPDSEGKLSAPDALAQISAALEAAWRYGIVDSGDHCIWVQLYLVTNRPFWENPFFQQFLEDPLFHPSTKVRNLAESFKFAARGAGE